LREDANAEEARWRQFAPNSSMKRERRGGGKSSSVVQYCTNRTDTHTHNIDIYDCLLRLGVVTCFLLKHTHIHTLTHLLAGDAQQAFHVQTRDCEQLTLWC
jgi:hypothetical protein